MRETATASLVFACLVSLRAGVGLSTGVKGTQAD